MLTTNFVVFLTVSLLGTPSNAYKSDDQITLAGNDAGGVRPEVVNYQHYVALGDSYSAGINANPRGQLNNCTGDNCGINPPYMTTAKCARNTFSYPWDLQFPSMSDPIHPTATFPQFTFMACSGANTSDFVNVQIADIPADADLITFTIGGNDGSSFANVAAFCVYLALQDPDSDAVLTCNQAIQQAITTINGIDNVLLPIYNRLRTGWPQAKIIALGYAKFWPTDTYNAANCNSSFLSRVNETRRVQINNLVTALNGQIAAAAARTNIDYFSIDGLFQLFRFCDSFDSHIQYLLLGDEDENKDSAEGTRPIGSDGDKGEGDGFIDVYNKGVMHPNAAGHLYIEDALRNYIFQGTPPPFASEPNDEL